MKRIVLLLAMLATPSMAQEMQYSSGLFCDTPEQVIAVMSAEDHVAALAAVNADAGKLVCARALLAWTTNGTKATFKAAEGAATVDEIVVHGISRDGITMMAVPSIVQYIPVLTTQEVPKTSV